MTIRDKLRSNGLPYERVTVDIVIPVYNEEKVLRHSVTTLCDYLGSNFPHTWSIAIADNASTDGTLAVAQDIAAADPRVSVLHLDQKGRGRALRAAWDSASVRQATRIRRVVRVHPTGGTILPPTDRDSPSDTPPWYAFGRLTLHLRAEYIVFNVQR